MSVTVVRTTEKNIAAVVWQYEMASRNIPEGRILLSPGVGHHCARKLRPENLFLVIKPVVEAFE